MIKSKRMKFQGWLISELSARKMSQADLSRATMRNKKREYHLSQAQISRIVSGEREPGMKSCIAIAFALGMSEEEVFRIAGIPIGAEEGDARTKAVMPYMRRLDDETFQDVMEYIKWRASSPKSRANNESL